MSLGIFGKSILAAGCACSVLAVSLAHAHDHGNEWIFDKPYANVGNWRIVAGTGLGDTCVAELDNDQVTLRVMYTEYTGDWHFGHPYYGEDHPMASFGIGEKGFINDGIQMQNDVVNGWAMFNFSSAQHILNDIEEGQYLTLKIDRGVQSWQMNNKVEAIAKLKECALAGVYEEGEAEAEPVPSAPSQPAAPTAAASGNSCPAKGSIRSPGSNDEASVIFTDPTFSIRAKSVYWIGFEGELVEMGPIFDGKIQVTSYVGHKFLVKDAEGKCYGGPFEVKAGSNNFIVQ